MVLRRGFIVDDELKQFTGWATFNDVVDSNYASDPIVQQLREDIIDEMRDLTWAFCIRCELDNAKWSATSGQCHEPSTTITVIVEFDRW